MVTPPGHFIAAEGCIELGLVSLLQAARCYLTSGTEEALQLFSPRPFHGRRGQPYLGSPILARLFDWPFAGNMMFSVLTIISLRGAQGLNSRLVPVNSDQTLDAIAIAQFNSIPAGGGFSVTPSVNGDARRQSHSASSLLSASPEGV